MRNRILTVLALGALAAAASASGFTLVWKLLFIAAAVVVLGYLWAVLGTWGIHCQTHAVARRYQVGDRLESETVLTNTSGLPKFMVQAAEDTDVPGYENSSMINLPPGGQQHLHSKFLCEHRGRFQFGSFTLTAGDPLGITAHRRRCGVPRELLVYPATVELPFFDLAPLGKATEPSRWLAGGSGPEVGSIRQYTVGDSLRHVHWPRTAHAGELLVKTFDRDSSRFGTRSLWVVLDMCRDSYLDDHERRLEECGVTVAASLIRKHIHAGLAVGLIATGSRPCLYPPESGEQHLWRMLASMALVEAKGSILVDGLVQQEAARFGSDSALIVITGSRSMGLVAALRRLRPPRELTTVVLLHGTDGKALARVAGALALDGVQVYQVAPGQDLATALSSRRLAPRSGDNRHARYDRAGVSAATR